MELVLAVFAVIVIFFIGYIVGAKQMSKMNYEGSLGNYTSGPVNWTPPTSSVEEVPAELLMGGNIEKALHIAGVKEASWETQKQWADERKTQVEEKSALSDKQLMEYIEAKNEEILVKAGIKEYDRNKGVTDLTKKIQSIVKSDDIDEVELTKLRVRAARKQAERDREDKLKIDFEALNFSRISNEARKQITEIVKLDLEKKLLEASEVLPEIKEEKPKRKTKKTK
jgi:hypothetical protein